MSRAPCLVLAIGNPSRGDDALGPRLLERLRGAGVDSAGSVELMTDFQLQVEHALDLRGRRAVLFVDAAWPGTTPPKRSGATPGAMIVPISADAQLPPCTHALRPQQLLRVAERIGDCAPPAWQLAIEGCSFTLGENLTPLAEQHLEQAAALALAWLDARGAGMTPGSAAATGGSSCMK